MESNLQIPEEWNPLSDNDKKIMGNLFQMLGYCQAMTGLRLSRNTKPDDKYLGRLIAELQIHVMRMETLLDVFAEAAGYK